MRLNLFLIWLSAVLSIWQYNFMIVFRVGKPSVWIQHFLIRMARSCDTSIFSFVRDSLFSVSGVPLFTSLPASVVTVFLGVAVLTAVRGNLLCFYFVSLWRLVSLHHSLCWLALSVSSFENHLLISFVHSLIGWLNFLLVFDSFYFLDSSPR